MFKQFTEHYTRIITTTPRVITIIVFTTTVTTLFVIMRQGAMCARTCRVVGYLEEPVGLVAVVGVDVVKGFRRLHQQMVSPVWYSDVDRRELVIPRAPTEHDMVSSSSNLRI